ncbi:hypothetical protein JB92DRAFT_657400 [Gautieria morchelliformis]|nr:hypothetical protein JB92DRAFT_657400 [Gautieria morchelliformis]
MMSVFTRLLRFTHPRPSVAPFFRGMASSAAPSDPPSKPKPKATTSLRRAASASLPIRANPTPTRGSIQPVFTLTTAERYVLPRLLASSALPSIARTFQEACWIPKWGSPGSEGEIFVFSNGSFVCWGLGEGEAERFKKEVIQNVPGVQVAPLKEDETEDLEYVTDPTESTRLQGDLIILGSTPPLSDPSTLSPLLSALPASTLPLSSLPARYAFSDLELDRPSLLPPPSAQDLGFPSQSPSPSTSENDHLTESFHAPPRGNPLRDLRTERHAGCVPAAQSCRRDAQYP